MNALRQVICAVALLLPAGAAAQADPCRTPAGAQIIPCTGVMSLDNGGRPLVAAGRSITGTLSANGADAQVIELRGTFNITFRPSADAVLSLYQERSFDQGVTWFVADSFVLQSNGDPGAKLLGASNSTALADTGRTLLAEEPEAGVLHRMRVGAYTSGSVTYRLSQ